MTTHEFTIPVHDLDAAGKHFVFKIRPEWLRGALEGGDVRATSNAGELDVRASKSGNDVIVHGQLKAELEVPCARCLSPARVVIDQRLTALMVPAHAMKSTDANEYEFSADEADIFPYDGESAVLDDLVRDELLLEIPMIPLCSEDCPGISPAPDLEAKEPADRPIDPRLAPLLRFRQKI
jgi:uncharacterized protein